jgi:hypothetical protein
MKPIVLVNIKNNETTITYSEKGDSFVLKEKEALAMAKDIVHLIESNKKRKTRGRGE